MRNKGSNDLNIVPFLVGKNRSGRALIYRLPGMLFRLLLVLPFFICLPVAILIALPVWMFETYEGWCGKKETI